MVLLAPQVSITIVHFHNLSCFSLMFRYERKWGDGVRSDERKERTEIFLVGRKVVVVTCRIKNKGRGEC